MARVVMFVLNDCRTDARVLREAGTLGAAGHEVTILARTTDPYAAESETERREGFRIIRVPVAEGPLRLLLLGRTPRRLAVTLAASARRAARAGPAGLARLLLAIVLAALLVVPALLLAVPVALAALALTRIRVLRPVWLSLEWRLQWAFGVVPWSHAAIAAAPPADIFHAHDLRALPPAIGARDRSGGRLVYDSHEIFVEAGANAVRPRRAREALRRREQALARRADALVTVNDELAAVLGPALGLADRTVVVRNCPPRWTPPAMPGPLRAAAGVADGTPLLLCHGAFVPHRGFEQVAAAMERPELAGVHGVFLGRGPLRARLDELASNPALHGRLLVLDAVHPDVLVDWIAGADVDVVAIQPTTLNHRLSTPNKLFESLAAGVPVVASDFPAMRGIVAGDPDGPLGALCDPSDPAALATAIRSVLDRSPEEAADLRRRCLEAAHRRWNWEIEGARLLALYETLADPAPAPGHRAGAGGMTGQGSAAAELGPAIVTPPMASPTPQRLVIVVPSPADHDSRTARIAGSVASRGHEVTVLARSGADAPAGTTDRDGHRLVRVDAGSARRLPLPLRVVDRALVTRRQARAAATVDRGADLYHGMAFMGLPVALRLAHLRGDVPVVYDARDLYADARGLARLPGLARAVVRARERSWARRASRVVTVNDGLADVLAERFGVERPVVVRNCAPRMPLPEPRLHRFHDALGLEDTARIVLYHGGLDAGRGIEQLLAATPGLPLDAVVVLLGYGPMRELLAARLRADPVLGARVRLLDAVPPAELHGWVASADVDVVAIQPTTLNHRLSTPNKLFEALAAGVPVVASDFPAMRSIVADDPDGPLGVLCDPRDPGAIAAGIRQILELAPGDAADLRARCARAASLRYAWETQLEVLLSLYGQLTGRPW